MKIVSLEVKKIRVGQFFPNKKEVELNIAFNDGVDKEIFKTVDTVNPDTSAENILLDLRKLEKKIHKEETEGTIIDNFTNVVIKDEEELIKEISKFINKVSIKIGEISNKKVAEGYLDRIRELKSLKLEF